MRQAVDNRRNKENPLNASVLPNLPSTVCWENATPELLSYLLKGLILPIRGSSVLILWAFQSALAAHQIQMALHLSCEKCK